MVDVVEKHHAGNSDWLAQALLQSGKMLNSREIEKQRNKAEAALLMCPVTQCNLTIQNC